MADHYVQSSACRRIVGRLVQGTEALDAFSEVCARTGVRAGEVRATGVLADVVLSHFDPDVRSFRSSGTIAGAATLVQAYGNVSEMGGEIIVGLRALVGWTDRGQLRVAAGHLVRANVVAVEFVIDAFDDVTLARGMDARLGMPLLDPRVDGPARRPPPPPAPTEDGPEARLPGEPAPLPSAAPLPTQRPMGWSDVVELSQGLDEAEDDGWIVATDVDVRRGDVFLHPRFGRCLVVRVEAEERAVMRDETGKPRTLSLQHMHVQERSEPGARKRTFEVQMATPRR